jgi:hypothetical protein
MSILKKTMAVALSFLAGCFVGYDESPRHYDASSRTEATVVVEPEVEEVNDVVYREYFGCTETEIRGSGRREFTFVQIIIASPA